MLSILRLIPLLCRIGTPALSCLVGLEDVEDIILGNVWPKLINEE